MTSLGMVLRSRLLVLIVILRVIAARVHGVYLGGLLLVGIEVVKKQIVVLDSVFQVIHDLLLLVYFDAEAAPFVENVFVVVHVKLATQTATACDNLLSLRFRIQFSLFKIGWQNAVISLHHYQIGLLLLASHGTGHGANVSLTSVAFLNLKPSSLSRGRSEGTSTRRAFCASALLLATVASISHLTLYSVLDNGNWLVRRSSMLFSVVGKISALLTGDRMTYSVL